MASKSLGKISAVLVANPAPWRKGLNESAASLKSWAKSVDGQIRSAQTNARKSFDGILTKFQQLQRALDAGTGTKLSFRGLDVSARQIRDLAASAELIAKPLGNAVRQFQNLSAEVQTGFLPALAKAQRDVAGLEDAIVKNGSATEAQFNRATISVEKTEAAIKRLSQAQSLASGFATGGELAFRDPRLSGSLQSGRNASQRLLEIGGVDAGQLASELGIAAQKAVELRAAVESTKGSEFTGNLSRAEASLLNQLAYLDSLIKKANEFGNVQAASGKLNILQELSDPPTAATPLPQGYLQDRAERAARDEIGAGVDPAIRKVQQLGSQVQSVRSQIDALPATIGSEFVPRLREAEQAFVRLRTSGRATAEEIENASNEVQQLAAQVRRVSQAQNIPSFADNLDDTALRGAIGNLQALQQILNRVGATAGSDGARQFDRLRDAIQRATNAGTIGSQAFQDELEEITQDAAAAAAATGKIGKSAAFREIQRGGDIARGGFDKFSLAAQQAAFAIDDFFSATGDFSQKIRAVQNNVTQLAFVVGGTTGLFIGLGVALAAQAAVALVKWANGSVDAEDKTQALNDALARQKSLVEELKQAFDSLGDSLTRGIFDEVTERAREFNRQIEDIRRKSAEVRQEQAASLDAGVNEQRAIQVDLRSQLDRETDAGARVGIERRIAASQEEERRLARQAANRRVDVEGVLREVAESFSEQADAAVKDIFADSTARAGPTAAERFAAAREADALSQPVIQRSQSESEAARRAIRGAGGNALDIAEILDGRVQELSDRLSESVGPQETRAINQQIGELESVLRSLKAPIERALLELRLNILDSAQEVAGSLRASKDIIENSLGDFGPLAAVQRELSSRFNAVVKELKTGRLGGEDDGRELNREEIQQRKAVLERLQQETQQLESTTRSAEALEKAFRRLADQLAETVRQEAAADVERTRRAANAAEARDGNGLDDFRRAAEREFAQGPQVEPLIDLEPLQARVQADLEAANTEANRVAAELQRRVDADRQAVDRVDQNLVDQTGRLLGFDFQKKAGEVGADIDTALAARGQLQTRSVEDVRQAFLDAGAEERSLDEAIARRLEYQEDEQKWWANRGARYEEEVRKLKAAEAALDSAFSTDQEQQRFVAAYNELTSKTELGVEGASKRLSEITKQFTDRLSDEQLAELTRSPFQASNQELEGVGGRLKALIDYYGLETAEGLRDSISSQDLSLDGLNEAIRKQITDSLDPGQLTPASIEAIRSETGRRSRISDETRGDLSAIRDFRRFEDADTRGFVLEESSIQSLREAGSQLRDSARELSSAEFSNERNQELASEIESIRNAIDAFDGSLESRRAIVEAADASRFDEIADAADIFLQKVRDLDLERAVSAFEEQIALEGQQRIEQLDQQRQEFQRDAQERFQRRTLWLQEALGDNAPEGIADAIRQRDELLSVNNRTAEQESQLAQANEAIQNAFEQTAEGQQAARLADEIDVERQRQVQAREQRDAVRESAARGQDLLLRREDVAARRGLAQFEDAQNAVLENLIGPLNEVGGDGVAAEIEDGILSLQELAQILKRSPEIRQQLEGEIQESLANLQQARDNITGNISAQIAQFDAERSRPSRQALQAQDINTQQGRAELNRLLRGDDANRDQPILQGIKEQTAVLKLIDQRIDEFKTAVGVAGA